MALSADRDTKYSEGVEISVPVKASTKIYAGSGVVAEATGGFAVEAVNTANYKTLGVAQEQVDNSSGADAAKSIRVRRKGCFPFAITGTQADIGKTVYWTDGGSVTTTVGNGVVAGKIAWVESTSIVWVDIDMR
jgi:hypothetical protein